MQPSGSQGLAWPTPQILPSPREGWALGCTPGPALDLCPQPPPSPTHGSPAPQSPVSAPLMEPPIPEQSPWGKPQFGILQRERAPVAPGCRGQLFPPPLGLSPVSWVPWPLHPPRVTLLVPALRIFSLFCFPC